MQTLARLIGALAISAGAMFVTYGAATMGSGAAGQPSTIPEPASTVSVGVGLLVGGLLAIALFGTRRPKAGE